MANIKFNFSPDPTIKFGFEGDQNTPVSFNGIQIGKDGTPAGFGTPTATVDENIGTPGVSVTASGPDTAKVFNFAFTNLKGAKGDTGATGEKGEKGDKGDKGDTGDSGLPDTEINNTVLKGVLGGDPVWSKAIYAVERDPASSTQGLAILSAGTNVDQFTDGGYVGAFRLFRASGNNVASVTVAGDNPSDEGFTRTYALSGKTPNSTAYVATSSSKANSTGNIAKFDGGTSIVEGIPESSIEQNTNKTTSLSPSSSDTEYPSAKAVYDGLAGKQDAGDYAASASGDTTQTAIKTASIPYGQVDSTSTSTAYTATIPGITELRDGVCVLLKNGVVTSAAGFTININGLGAKPSYNNMAAATADTTLFNVNYTMLFVYDSTRVTGGCWICYRGYNSDTNTIGYQLRTNATVMKASDRSRYYKIFFTSADGTKLVPASSDWTNSATSAKTVNQRPIDPFGRISYTSATTNYTADSAVAATTLWEQYDITLGYSFNRTGQALTLTPQAPVYVKCAPQSDGSAIMDSTTPIVQALPATDDGKIYIFLGIATSATKCELFVTHPVYYYMGGRIRLWTGKREPDGVNVFTGSNTIDEVYASFITGVPTYIFRDSKMYLVNDLSYMTGTYADKFQISALGSSFGGVSYINLHAIIDKEIPSGTLCSSLSTLLKMIS